MAEPRRSQLEPDTDPQGRRGLGHLEGQGGTGVPLLQGRARVRGCRVGGGCGKLGGVDNQGTVGGGVPSGGSGPRVAEVVMVRRLNVWRLNVVF